MLQSSIFKVSELILKQMCRMSETERAESEELITVHMSFYSAVQNIKTSQPKGIFCKKILQNLHPSGHNLWKFPQFLWKYTDSPHLDVPN